MEDDMTERGIVCDVSTRRRKCRRAESTAVTAQQSARQQMSVAELCEGDAPHSNVRATVSCAKHHAVPATQNWHSTRSRRVPKSVLSGSGQLRTGLFRLLHTIQIRLMLATPAGPRQSTLQIQPRTHHAVQAVQVALDLLWAGAVLLSALLDHVACALSIPIAVVQDAGGKLAVPASPARLLQAPRRLWPSCTAARSTKQPRHRMLMEARSPDFSLLPVAVTLTYGTTITLSVSQMMQSVTQYSLQPSNAWPELRMVGQSLT